MKLQIPRYALALLNLARRYKILAGGRGSGKSYAIADCLLLLGSKQKIRVLCAREFQNSITESVHYLLRQEIDRLGLNHLYSITNQSIVGTNGTEFIFKGIRSNIDSIKSMAGITHVWIEEAHSISQFSWDVLIPTIREPGSEIWCSFNPDKDTDPVYTMFFTKDGYIKERDDAYVEIVNWMNNPWFPDVLKAEKDHLYRVNPDLADHVWGGNCRSHSDAQIFRHKWEVRAFEDEGHFYGPYFGADFGFSTDPSTLVKLYIDRRDGLSFLYIRYAIFGQGIEIDNLPAFYDKVPESRGFKIRADNARPETISFIGRQGFDIEAALKWPGSVEDGIEWLKIFDKIIIHPDNPEMIEEAKNYSYKVDRLTADVLTDVVDAYNHGWDAIRYACQPMISAGSISMFDVL